MSSTDRRFYVYIYTRHTKSKYGDVGTPYYIGKGTNKRAFKKGCTESTKVPKNKSNILIPFYNLTEREAFQLEIDLIKGFGRVDMSTGVLRNQTNGGEGFSGVIHTKEHKEKIRNAHIANGMIRSVLCIETGNPFSSASDAATWLAEHINYTKSITNIQQKISACCRSERTSAYGYTWMLVGGESPREKIDVNKDKRVSVKSTSILDNQIRIFSSISDASIYIKGDSQCRANIRRCLSGKTKTAYGHMWEYV